MPKNWVVKLKDSQFRQVVEKNLVTLASDLGYFRLVENAPTFLVIGAQKAGTSSVYNYLKDHPQILTAARRKEAHYFDRPVHYPDERWYRNLFRVTGQRNVEDIVATGEFSPEYCFMPDAIARIHMYAPQVKLIMLVRNPISRAVSHYWMNHRRGEESLPMREAFAAEEERIHSSHYSLGKHSYLARGRYHEQITKIYHYFPPEQVLIRRTNELSQETQRVMREITDFIGVNPLKNQKFKHYSKKEYPRIEADLQAELSTYFAPHNQQLTERYGIHTDDWD